MKTFSDRNGRSWRVDLSFALWRRIKAETGIDLLDIAMPDGKSLRQLSEMENVGVVLWLYVEAEAVESGIDRETFWLALHGPAIEAGMQAIVDDLEDFSRSPQVTALRVAMAEAVTKVEESRADILNPEGKAGKLIRDVMRSESPPPTEAQFIPTDMPANAPASSAATPTSGDSESSSGPPTPSAATTGITPA